MTDLPPVTDDPAAHRFEVTVDGRTAELVYRRTDGRIELVHTGVPDELEGRGVGGALVRAAVARAADEGLTVIPSCRFAAGWLERHPDEAAKVSVEAPSRDR